MSHYLQEQASASGHHGQAWASGDYGQASATGKYGLAVAQRRVAAGESGAIVARCWDEEEQEYRDIDRMRGGSAVPRNPPMRWSLSTCGDRAVIRFARRHYSSRRAPDQDDPHKVGSNGRQLVLTIGDPLRALWITTWQDACRHRSRLARGLELLPIPIRGCGRRFGAHP